MKLKSLIALALSFTALNALALSFGFDKVIYGDDHRRDILDVQEAMYLDLAKSTAAMISKSTLEKDEDGVYTKIVANTLGRRQNLCSDEPFRDQPAAANCSGFLVGEDLLVTAGHCMKKNWNGQYANCSSYAWVFDFAKKNFSQTEYRVETSSVYNCKEVISQTLDNGTKNDFALIRLDRKVTDRDALTVRTEEKVSDEAPLVVIGHPSGLPTKVADGANVRSNEDSVYFVANLDTYGGNSGSAVFNSHTGVVEGILVRGEQDYRRDSRGCVSSYRCADDGCRGEDVTRITNIEELMKIARKK